MSTKRFAQITAVAVAAVSVAGVTGPALASARTQAPAAVTATAARPTLAQGARGTAVRMLQQRLTARGRPVPATGYFGPQTRAAVLAVQKAHRLTTDGIVGARTWAALMGPATARPAPARPATRTAVVGVTANPGSAGYGTARPGRLDLGGDPTGVVKGITWSSWGGATATGRGTGYWLAPHAFAYQAAPAKATVTLSGLVSCAGTPTYTKVSWTFPGKTVNATIDRPVTLSCR